MNKVLKYIIFTLSIPIFVSGMCFLTYSYYTWWSIILILLALLIACIGWYGIAKEWLR